MSILTLYKINVKLHLDKYLNERRGKVGFQESFKALSDPTRREILNLLKNGALTAGDIGSHFEMTGATISHHLSILKEADLINDERQGKYIYYELNMTVVDEIMGWMIQLKRGNKDEK